MNVVKRLVRIRAAIPVALAVLGFAGGGQVVADEPKVATITVNAAKTGVRVSPTLWGVFYEEINHAGDGGIYAELVQNRAFEELQMAAGATLAGNELVTPKGFKHRKWYQNDLPAWSVVEEGGARVAIALDDVEPLNERTPHAMRVEIKQVGGRAGVANAGYWGMSVVKGEPYNLSFYARTAGRQNITARLESDDGKKTYAVAEVAGVAGGWKRYTCRMVADGTDPKARLTLGFSEPGTIWLDVVSLFPRTYKDRPNGLRPDLVELLRNLKPAFFRFPGGCVVEGVTLQNRILWKNTVGDIAQRPGRWNLWGYHNTEGLGFHEYLQLCEDLDAAPMYVVNAGFSCHWRKPEIADEESLKSYILDTLDALEYANGPVTSRWGAERSKNGHPAPFNIKYVEIGNENEHEGAAYFKNYRLFHDAIKAAYPDIVTIANCAVPGHPVEIVDEHYYENPEWFFSNASRYDRYNRSGPKIYVGEYAVNRGVGAGNVLGALAEAAFMLGMERNSDVVVMGSYAPLFENVHNLAWPVNLIRFDSSRSTGRSSYHVQTMFSANRPDVTLETSVEAPVVAERKPSGSVGVGTWDTQAEYKDVVVTQGGRPLYRSDFSKGTEGWTLVSGEWTAKDGALRQSAKGDDRMALVGNTSWTDYTLSLKARKLGGSEGFLVLFRVTDAQNLLRWNIGGWLNSRSAVEVKEGGSKRELARGPAGGVEMNRWYDIRVEVAGDQVSCYLDGKLSQSAKLPLPWRAPGVFAGGGRDERTGDIIVKAVNPAATAVAATIRITGAEELQPLARVTTLSGSGPADENTLDEPGRVVPVGSVFNGVAPEFRYTLKPYSLTVLRLATRR